MKKREFRCPSISFILILALLPAILPRMAAAEGPRISPPERAAFELFAPAEAKSCQRCALAQKKCSATCFALAQKEGTGGMGSCLTACDNATAACTCDEAVNLRSEDLVARAGLDMTKSTACHTAVSCQPNFPSCASWTAYADCGDPFCGSAPHCGECTCDEFRCFCGPGPAWKQTQERFRVCFDSLGNSCTEWQKLTFNSCGC